MFYPISAQATEKTRKVIQFGYEYNYQNKNTFKPIQPIPNVLKKLLELLPSVNYNQCILNRYLPEQGINPHIDNVAYGETIACFTFLGSREMEFDKDEESFCLVTEPGSAYIMTGDTRYKWRHQMRGRLFDNKKRRTEYFSVTFRQVVSAGNTA